MKFNQFLFILFLFSSCTTIHFRSQNSVPISFEGNPKHKREVSIAGHKNFYFWGLEPEEHEVFIDEEVRKAGHDSLSPKSLHHYWFYIRGN